MRKAIALTLVAAGLGVITFAQVPQARPDEIAAERMATEMRAQVATLRAGVETRFTQGRPYSGEAVNEFVQVLSDGNRITRSSTTKVFRDNEGRTRRETEQSISINDPVARASYVLDPVKRTAVRALPATASPSWSITAGEKMTVEQAKVEEVKTREAGGRGRATTPGVVEPVLPSGGRVGGGGRGGVARSGGPGETKSESLGQKMIEGVMAEGTRTTTVIPAGAIGNLQPITIVTEQWFSTDLQVLVMTRHSDPRSGESTYRLTNIQRAEPDRSLFEIPPDYTVREQGNRLTPVLRER